MKDGLLLDIDGCIFPPGGYACSSPLSRLCDALAKVQQRGLRVMVSSGRPAAFVEAVATILGINGPLMFEWGCGMMISRFDRKPLFHPSLDRDFWDQRDWLFNRISAAARQDSQLWIEPGKLACITVFSADSSYLDEFEILLGSLLVEQRSNMFSLHRKLGYIDIRARRLGKMEGFVWCVEDVLGEPLNYDAWIGVGDTVDDASLLAAFGRSVCPANADAAAKRAAKHVSKLNYSDCIVEYLSLVRAAR